MDAELMLVVEAGPAFPSDVLSRLLDDYPFETIEGNVPRRGHIHEFAVQRLDAAKRVIDRYVLSVIEWTDRSWDDAPESSRQPLPTGPVLPVEEVVVPPEIESARLDRIVRSWLDRTIAQLDPEQPPSFRRVEAFHDDTGRLTNARIGFEHLLSRVQRALDDGVHQDPNMVAELTAARDVLIATSRNPNPNPVVVEATAADVARLLKDVTDEPRAVGDYLSDEGIPEDVADNVTSRLAELLQDVASLDPEAPDGGLTDALAEVADVGREIAAASDALDEQRAPDEQEQRPLREAFKRGAETGVEHGVDQFVTNAIGKAVPAALIAGVLFVINAATGGGLLSGLLRVLIAIIQAAGG